MDIIQRIEFQQRAEAVEHQLAVAMSFYANTASTLEVDNLQHAIRNDHKVACTKPIRNILTVIQPMLHHDQWIRTGRPDRLDGFNAEGNVFVRDAFGLVRVEIVVTVLVILLLNEVRGHIA